MITIAAKAKCDCCEATLDIRLEASLTHDYDRTDEVCTVSTEYGNEWHSHTFSVIHLSVLDERQDGWFVSMDTWGRIGDPIGTRCPLHIGQPSLRY